MLYGRDGSALTWNWSAVGSDGHYGSYISRERLFYDFVVVTLYEKQLQLGMLNPYATLFVPQRNYGREENHEKSNKNQSSQTTKSKKTQTCAENRTTSHHEQNGTFTEKWIASGRIFQ